MLLAFGLASLGLAALYLASQRDLKRLFAYSSVEHMGVLAIGMSFSAPIAVVGVLLHVLAHAAAKGTAFFGAGSVVRKFGTKDMDRIRGGIGALPWSGPMLVLAVLGLCALPPFGIFRSEFLIVSGGLSDPRDAVAAVLVVLVTLATLGLTWFTSQTMLSATPQGVERGETSRWIVAAMLVGLVALAVLGRPSARPAVRPAHPRRPRARDGIVTTSATTATRIDPDRLAESVAAQVASRRALRRPGGHRPGRRVHRAVRPGGGDRTVGGDRDRARPGPERATPLSPRSCPPRPGTSARSTTSSASNPTVIPASTRSCSRSAPAPTVPGPAAPTHRRGSTWTSPRCRAT